MCSWWLLVFYKDPKKFQQRDLEVDPEVADKVEAWREDQILDMRKKTKKKMKKEGRKKTDDS